MIGASGPGSVSAGSAVEGSVVERWVEGVLTVAAAGIATAVAVNGMWRVFGDQLGFTSTGRAALAGFLEIAMVVSAIRARRALRTTGTVGVDGAAVWALAVLSAVIASADAVGLARGVRFAAPLVAAWLWERGLAPVRRHHTAARQGPSHPVVWRWTPARVAVRVGLADPTVRSHTDLDRARRLARLTRARLRLAVLEAPPGSRLLAALTWRSGRTALAVWRLQRHALAAVEHLDLGADLSTAAAIRTTVAALTGLRDATAPAALTAASPWNPQHLPQLDPAPAVLPVAAATAATVPGRVSATLPRLAAGRDPGAVADDVTLRQLAGRARESNHRAGEGSVRRLLAQEGLKASNHRVRAALRETAPGSRDRATHLLP